MDMAQAGVEELTRHSDSLIVIPNEQLVTISQRGMSLIDAFRPADEILQQAIQGVAKLITLPGLIGVDFNDVRTVMSKQGGAKIGMGIANGEQRALNACTIAIMTPLLLKTDLQGARGLIINISASSDMTMEELDAITSFFHDIVDPQINIIIGLVFDEELQGQIKVIVIATGLTRR